MKPLRTALAAGLIAFAPFAAFAEGQLHKLAIHVDEDDRQLLNMALNNAQNVANHYAAQGDSVIIEVVAYGPGLSMFVDGESPVADRISTMALEMEGISFSACGNTITNREKKQGKPVALLAEAQVVPSGVVRLMELQGEGYAYIRP
jgi:intracellular sulfur oxidation DsrE/DsrF family protein